MDAPTQGSWLARVGGLLLSSLLALGFVSGVPASAGADSEESLVARYHEVDRRHGDRSYAALGGVLEKLADRRTEASHAAIRMLLAEERAVAKEKKAEWPNEDRRVDSRCVVLLLTALVRGGGVDELDEAIRVAEAERGGVVTGSLALIFAAVIDEPARAHLRGPLLVRTAPSVKSQVARGLGILADKEAVVPLIAALREDAVEVRAEALLALGKIGDPVALSAIAPFLGGRDPRLRAVAAQALGSLGSPEAAPLLAKALTDPSSRVAESAAGGLALLRAWSAIPSLIDRLAALNGQDLRLEEGLQEALVRITEADLGTDANLWRAWWLENRDHALAGVAHPKRPAPAPGSLFFGLPVRSSRMLFVVDVSRSMGWNDRLDVAKMELREVIEHLPATTRFDVISYGEVASAWAGKLVPASSENVLAALQAVERLEPLSETNIHDALQMAFRVQDADTIYLLSDGTPTVGATTDPEAILVETLQVNRWRRVRIHTCALLLGDPPPDFPGHEDPEAATSFLRRLAEENGGKFKLVR